MCCAWLRRILWGYDRIQGVLANLGYPLSDRTVGNILKAHGIEPAPDRRRQSTWKTFLQAHWDVLSSIDFTTTEAWTKTGLINYYLPPTLSFISGGKAMPGILGLQRNLWVKRHRI